MSERKIYIGGVDGNGGRRYTYDSGEWRVGLSSMPGNRAFYALVDENTSESLGAATINARTAFRLLSRFLGLVQGPGDCRTIEVPSPIMAIVSTPWGPNQCAYEYAPGIISYSTAGHGGFWLDTERMAEFRAQFPSFETYAGGPWFEEDEDCTVVILAFAECFDDYAVWSALRHVRQSWPEQLEAWAELPCAALAIQRSQTYYARSKRLWRAGSCSTSGHGWNVSFRRLDDSEQCYVAMPEYPAKPTYSDEELQAFTRLEPAHA
jgi:hypothetical protein